MIHPTAKASREPIAAAFSSQYDKRGWGTEGSNPSLSSGESVSRPNPRSWVDNPGFPRGFSVATRGPLYKAVPRVVSRWHAVSGRWIVM